MGAKINFGGTDGVGPLIDAITRKVEKMEGGFRDVNRETKRATKDAERLWKQAQTPLQRYNDTLRRARSLLDGTAEGQRKHAQVVDMANRRLREQQSFFGAGAVTKIMKYAHAWLAAAGGIGAVTQAFRVAKQARDEFSQSQSEGAVSGAELAQVAYQIPGGMPAAKKMSDILRGTEGLTPERANSLLFSLASAPGALKEREFFGALTGRGAVRNVDPIVATGAAVRTNFPGRNFTFEDVADMTFAAAGANPARAQVLGAQMGPVAQLASVAGIKPAEMYAAVAMLAQGTTSPEMARTQVMAMMAGQAANPKFSGMSLRQMAGSFKGATLADIKADFPNIRAQAGIASLSGVTDELGALTASTSLEQSRGLSRRIARDPSLIPAYEADYENRRAKQLKLLTSERLGVEATQAQAAISGVEAEAANLGETGVWTSVRQTAARWSGGAARIFTDDPSIVAGVSRIGASLVPGWGNESNPGAGVADQLERIIQNTGRGDLAFPEN